MQTGAQPEEISGHSYQWKPLKDHLGGKRKPVFCGYAELRQLGVWFDAARPVALGLSGFGDELIQRPPMVGWRKTSTSFDVRGYNAFFRGPGVSSEALKIHFVARSISSSRSESSALHLALC
jgi:hypothetical protein